MFAQLFTVRLFVVLLLSWSVWVSGVAGSGMRVAGYMLLVLVAGFGCGFLVAGYGLQVAGCGSFRCGFGGCGCGVLVGRYYDV